MKRIFLIFCSLFISNICWSADEYPNRPITFILAVEPGSDGDVLARPLMQRVSKILGQPILIVNKPPLNSTTTPFDSQNEVNLLTETVAFNVVT